MGFLSIFLVLYYYNVLINLFLLFFIVCRVDVKCYINEMLVFFFKFLFVGIDWENF